MSLFYQLTTTATTPRLVGYLRKKIDDNDDEP